MFCTNCGKKIEDNAVFCTSCGENQVEEVHVEKDTTVSEPKKNKFISKLPVILSVALLLITVNGAIYFFNNPKTEIETSQEVNSTTRNKEIAATVVNIECEGEAEDSFSGGSGTLISEDGLVITNAHVVGEDDEASCFVTLPDPTDGSPYEIYTAYPIITPGVSKEYDLAFLQIDGAYYNREEDTMYGDYPKKFPTYDSTKYCKEGDVKLGESVRIYGYPSVTGGSSLTVTDGIVSSLVTDERLIITSAKISYGNSGGLAVDENGCRIGIPSMVLGDENESFGIIISNNLIYEFLGKTRGL